MRPAIISEYLDRHAANWAKRFAILRERDGHFRKLNAAYGLCRADDDSAPMSAMPGQEAVYYEKYREIDARYQPTYDSVSVSEAREDRSLGMTAFEFLVLDNLDQHTEKALSDKALENRDAMYFNFIRIRANAQIAKWSIELPVANILKLLDFERNTFTYKAHRCRKYLNVSVFNFPVAWAVFRFKREYLGALNESFGRLQFQKTGG